MKAIWKYKVPIEGSFRVDMPRGAVVLSVQVQHGIPCFWAMVDTDAPTESRRFVLAGTGMELINVDPARFIGTFQVLGGDAVFHLFGAEA